MKRSRLIIFVLMLALTIGAFGTMPAYANAGWICEDGCWDWDAQHGCNQEVTCCANDNGSWFCILW